MDKVAMSHPPPTTLQSKSVQREKGKNEGFALALEEAVAGSEAAAGPATDKSAKPQRTQELQRLADEAFAKDDLRLSISFNKDVGRFIYRGIDRETGEVVKEYPPEEVVERIATIREIAGIAFDRKF